MFTILLWGTWGSRIWKQVPVVGYTGSGCGATGGRRGAVVGVAIGRDHPPEAYAAAIGYGAFLKPEGSYLGGASIRAESCQLTSSLFMTPGSYPHSTSMNKRRGGPASPPSAPSSLTRHRRLGCPLTSVVKKGPDEGGRAPGRQSPRGAAVGRWHAQPPWGPPRGSCLSAKCKSATCLFPTTRTPLPRPVS